MRINGHRRRASAILLAMTLLFLGSSRVQAMYDMGMGWGWGGFGNVPSPSTYLNDHALVGAARGREGVPTRTPYANNPNSFINKLRDPGFVSHTDVRRRRPPTYRPEPVASLGNRNQAKPQPAADAATPLANFFSAARQLVWPSESPTHGDLQGKRDTSDLASLAVLDEKNQQGVASITIVATARERLIAYGQPALREIRTHSTAPIADAFHNFMLSLYESLAQAAEQR